MHSSVAFSMIVGVGVSVGLAYIIYTRRTEKSDTNRLIKATSIPGEKSSFSKQYLQRITAGNMLYTDKIPKDVTKTNPSKSHISKTIREIQPGEYNIDEHLETNPSKSHISKTIREIQPGEYNIDEHLKYYG